jgi:hypothetical protein
MEESCGRLIVLPAGDFILIIEKVERDRGALARAQRRGSEWVFSYEFTTVGMKEASHDSQARNGLSSRCSFIGI